MGRHIAAAALEKAYTCLWKNVLRIRVHTKTTLDPAELVAEAWLSKAGQTESSALTLLWNQNVIGSNMQNQFQLRRNHRYIRAKG